MFKLFHKKLNKKGFTLAELLVVVAIIAILVAIAIPIFTGALRDAQLRTNQANVRAVKAVAVTEILTNWSGTTGGKRISEGASGGWLVKANVDKTGGVTPKSITVYDKDIPAAAGTGIIHNSNLIPVSDDANSEFAKLTPEYEVHVLLKSIDLNSGIIS